MPHCTLFYSKTLNLEALDVIVSKLHQAMLESGLFVENAIKVRAIAAESMLTAGEKAPHLHAEIKLLQGRDEVQKSHLATLVNAVLRTSNACHSVEVIDLSPYYYNK
ncbi:5-carboxymethyl-2-hydroxymuconate Delta-isomerase [Fangia hongkongensis]|uniref:5-carboxymethyl-2-hydroxymuconate Delta-isomerase n=1 Tax=Fangia hongkongensis TaxID=270495 RepID=UPI00035E1C21|nr:hypothetical protein [Fangia hongkongensis]MBK2124901.1 hypothetical protein [Fangia hongkongensis]